MRHMLSWSMNSYTGLAVINSCTTDKNWPIIMQTGSPIKSNGPRQNKYWTYWSRKKYAQPHLPISPPLFLIKTFLTYPSWSVTAHVLLFTWCWIFRVIPSNTFTHVLLQILFFHNDSQSDKNNSTFIFNPFLLLPFFLSFIQFLSFLSELRIFQFLTVTWEIAGILN